MEAKPILSDERIAQLIAERKAISRSLKQWMKPRKVPKRLKRRFRGHAIGENGSLFDISATQNIGQPQKFSIMLMFVENQWRYPLVRFDGHAGPHKNYLEDRSDRDRWRIPAETCHIHRLTQRYQEKSRLVPRIVEDGFAQVANQFSCDNSAFDFFLSYCWISYTDLCYSRHNPMFPIEGEQKW